MNEKKIKAAVIGKKSTTALYGAAGVAVFDENEASAVIKLIPKLINGGYGIIFVTETLYRQSGEALKKYLDKPYPIIIPVPDENSDGTYSKARIAENVKKAVGHDLA